MIELQLDRDRAQATLVEQLVRAFSGAIEQLGNVKGLVIDLRGNTGGGSVRSVSLAC